MNKHYSEIAFVLDRSGSMESCSEAAIAGFNKFLFAQQHTEGLAKLTLVLFDDEYLRIVESVPVAEILPLTDKTYVPRNSTALLDAIGTTIDELGARLSVLTERDRPVQTIVAILTDGLENASEKFSWKDISAKIKHQSEVYKWTFLYPGANQDAVATAAQLSIASNNAATYVADGAGSTASHASFSRKVRSLRRSAMGIASVEERADAVAPLSAIVEDEDRKSRER